MQGLIERLESDYKNALKAGERTKIDTIRMVKASIQKAAIEKRKDALEDSEVLQILSQQAKQRKETLEAAKKADRQEIISQTNEELAIINAYLPKAISQDELEKLIDEAIQAVGANQGQVMKFIMSKAPGAIDGKTASQIVSQRLAKN